MAEKDNERLSEALRLTKQRLDDLVAIARERGAFDKPYDNTAMLIGTARRIGDVLEGGRFHGEYGA